MLQATDNISIIVLSLEKLSWIFNNSGQIDIFFFDQFNAKGAQV